MKHLRSTYFSIPRSGLEFFLAHHLRVLAVLAKVLSCVLNTCIRQLRTSCNPVPRDPMPSVLHRLCTHTLVCVFAHVCVHTHIHTQSHPNKKTSNKKESSCSLSLPYISLLVQLFFFRLYSSYPLHI